MKSHILEFNDGKKINLANSSLITTAKSRKPRYQKNAREQLFADVTPFEASSVRSRSYMPGTGTCEELSYNSSRFNSARHSEASNIEYNVNRLAKIVGLGQRIRNKRNSSHFMTYRQQKLIYESNVEKANRDKILQNEIIASLQEKDAWLKNNQVTSLNKKINFMS